MISVKGGPWYYLPPDIFDGLYTCLVVNNGHPWYVHRHFQALNYGARGREEL